MPRCDSYSSRTNMRGTTVALILVSICSPAVWTQHVFITTGYNDDGSLADTELLQLSPETVCEQKPADYPLYIRGTVGGLVQDKITVCGGGYFLVYSGECFQFDPQSNQWTEFPALPEIRSGAAALNVPAGFWVTGGYEGGPLKATTDIFDDASQSWMAGPEMPNRLYDHCMVQLNETHSAVIGGYSTEERILAELWIYNWSDQTWIREEDMAVPRDDHYCALLPDGNVLVAGGVTTDNEYTDQVEIFNVQTRTWETGPTLPENRWGGRTVTDESGQVWLVTGRTSLTYVSTVLKYTGSDWETMEESIGLPRHYATVLSVPSSAICPQS
eukprot:maker-scaffold1351_size46012-snap-gene-0.12 protein:Tk06397 transcript:maker-scaffold1351_size46012-snap-gene-0.12-mRNA-1 annotation:"hypothetical protein"